MNVSASGAQGAQENLKSEKSNPVEERVKNKAEIKTQPPESEKNNEVDNPNNGVDFSA